MNHAGVITVLALGTFDGSPSQDWYSPWFPWPEGVERGQMTVAMKTLIGTHLGATLQTMWDGGDVSATGLALGLAGPQLGIAEGAADFGRWVRLHLAAGGGPTICVVSAWVTPKRT